MPKWERTNLKKSRKNNRGKQGNQFRGAQGAGSTLLDAQALDMSRAENQAKNQPAQPAKPMTNKEKMVAAANMKAKAQQAGANRKKKGGKKKKKRR